MTNPNDPAFLTIQEWAGGTKTVSAGLTKREYFVAMALSGMRIDEATPEKAAEWAIRYADSVIAELNKNAKP